MSGPEKGERIAKVMARAGLCSRRDAERWIAEGRVAIGGQVLTTPAVVVEDPALVTVDGKPLPQAERTRLWRYHKPVGLVTTHRDPQGRPTLFDALPPSLPRVISVGRLDLNSEGLMLLTNDGELARRLELPTTGWTRRYRVRVHGTVDPASLARLARGVTVDGVRYGPIEAALDNQAATNAWVTMALKEGKNREIRRVLEHLGLMVTRLIRVSYGPFQLGNLVEGAVDEMPAKVVQDQLGGSPGRPAPEGGGGEAQRKPRPPGGRPPRGQAAEGRSPEGRSPEGRSPEGRSSEGRSAGGKPPDGKPPGGKPPGGKPPGGKPPGGKPPGGRPSGGRPSGGPPGRGEAARGRSAQGQSGPRRNADRRG